jgi:hypothetical protein
MKLEVIHLCAISDSSRNKTGRWYGFTTLTLFTILKSNEKILLAVLYDVSPAYSNYFNHGI